MAFMRLLCCLPQGTAEDFSNTFEQQLLQFYKRNRQKTTTTTTTKTEYMFIYMLHSAGFY